MDIRKLQRVIVDALDDVKAHDIRIFNTSEQTGLFDRVILATGTSNRQTRALASHVREKTKAAGGHVISTEGEETGEWVLVDLGDAVVHIMQPAIRVYYNLEELWGSKPVHIKRSEPAGALRSSRSAGKAVNDTTEQPPVRRAARKAPAKSDSREPAAATDGAPAQAEAKAPVRRRSNSAKATPEAASRAPRKHSTAEPVREPGERPAGTSSAMATATPGTAQGAAATPRRRAPGKARVA